jgi:hypothetical protein
VKEGIHAGSESDFRALMETRRHVRRWRFYCLVKCLCRKKGPLAWWRVHAAWRRIRRQPDKSQALWVSR